MSLHIHLQIPTTDMAAFLCLELASFGNGSSDTCLTCVKGQQGTLMQCAKVTEAPVVTSHYVTKYHY